MWDDTYEDNNPYAGAGSYSQQQDSASPNQHGLDSSPSPPSYKSNRPELQSNPNDLSDDEEADYKVQQSGQLPRKDGYDSRLQQMLWESPDLEILIVDARKSSHGSFIEYRIRTGVGLN